MGADQGHVRGFAIPQQRRPRRRLVVGIVVVLALLAVVAGVIGPRLALPGRLWSSPIETVSLDGRELHVVRVDYSSGLRQVSSLGSLDGALFALERPASAGAGMGMDDTFMPLDVVFFDPDGRFIDRFTMPVCNGDACPGYLPSRPWQFAIEAPAGSLEWVREGAVLVR